MANKKLIYLLFLFFLAAFISACSKEVSCAKDVKVCPGGATVERVPPSCGFAACPDVVCTQDAKECPDGSFVSRVAPYCNFAECPANNTYMFIGDSRVSLECSVDEDCTLIRKKYGFSCCYTGICEIYDYAHKDFVAVNRQDYDMLRQENCPRQEECGPAPLCSTRVVNEHIKAKCISGVCDKPGGYPESYYYT